MKEKKIHEVEGNEWSNAFSRAPLESYVKTKLSPIETYYRFSQNKQRKPGMWDALVFTREELFANYDF